MKTVLLCGGKGTRIRGVDDTVPKPMIPIGDQPIVVHIMEHYAFFGHRDFVLCLGYLGSAIRAFFGASASTVSQTVDFTLPRSGAVNITLVDTGLEAMTGARVRKIRDVVGESDFFLTYGDGVSDVPIDKVLSFHRSHRAALTLTAVRPPSRFGEVEVDPSGLATSFNEKPQASAGLISGGYFVCRSSLFGYLNDREDLVLEADPMRQMVRDKQLAAYTHEGFWQCMDTYRDWELLNELHRKDEAPWRH
ncbi:MAG: sugar phosphate nucleotidyltransferase [Actinomycetota bacterium]|jgi:glucose-1-phosphate cytidylyltransferase